MPERRFWTMNFIMGSIAKKVRHLRLDAGLSQSALARLVGVKPQAIQALEAGNIKKPKFILELANVLGVNPSELVDLPPTKERTVPIVGIAQAGTTNVTRSDTDNGYEETEAPIGATPNTVAVEVRGNSMGGRLEEGDLVFYDDRREPVTPDLIGRLCIVEKKNGEVVIKKLQAGSKPGLYHLISYNAEPEFDQELVWGARILSIRPK